MIVDDSFNYHARLNMNYHSLSSAITNYHQLSCSLDMFKLDMIVHDSFFFCLTERKRMHGSFSVSATTIGRDVTGKAKPERTGGKPKWISLASHIARFRQTIMNYHGPFDANMIVNDIVNDSWNYHRLSWPFERAFRQRIPIVIVWFYLSTWKRK